MKIFKISSLFYF